MGTLILAQLASDKVEQAIILSKDLRTSSLSLRSLQSRLSSANSSLSDCEKSRSSLSASLRAKDQQILSMSEKAEDDKSARIGLESKIKALTDARDLAKTSLETIARNYDLQRAKVELLSARHRKAEEKISSLDRLLSRERSLREMDADAGKKLAGKLAEREGVVDDLAAKLREKESEAKRAERSVEDLSRRLSMLQNEAERRERVLSFLHLGPGEHESDATSPIEAGKDHGDGDGEGEGKEYRGCDLRLDDSRRSSPFLLCQRSAALELEKLQLTNKELGSSYRSLASKNAKTTADLHSQVATLQDQLNEEKIRRDQVEEDLGRAEKKVREMDKTPETKKAHVSTQPLSHSATDTKKRAQAAEGKENRKPSLPGRFAKSKQITTETPILHERDGGDANLINHKKRPR